MVTIYFTNDTSEHFDVDSVEQFGPNCLIVNTKKETKSESGIISSGKITQYVYPISLVHHIVIDR